MFVAVWVTETELRQYLLKLGRPEQAVEWALSHFPQRASGLTILYGFVLSRPRFTIVNAA